MRFRVGDKVKFMNDVGGGRITKIVDKEIANVLNEDGFEVPVMLNELIKIDEDELISGGKSDSEPQEAFRKEPKNTGWFAQNEPAGSEEQESDELFICLAFVPQDIDDITNSDLDIYLVNDSNYSFMYHYVQIKDQLFNSRKTGILEPNTKVFLEGVYRYEVNRLGNIVIQGIPFVEGGFYEEMMTVHREIKMNPVKFFKQKSYEENDFFEEPAVVFTVESPEMLKHEIENLPKEELEKVIQKKEIESQKINKPKQFAKKNDRDEIIDLHIHELIEDEKGLTPKELLDIQMKHFHDAMEKAIKSPTRRIVFIHGLGNGTLKHEIRRELERKYKKYPYQDASYAEYGYGATMVILKGKT